jgi:hypothetical protein
MKFKVLFLLVLLAVVTMAQPTVRWAATTGDVSISAAYTATVQLASGASQALVDQIVVYCSVACSVTQVANGTAATTTAGTVTPILPAPSVAAVPVAFFTASNVGAGTAQGGAVGVQQQVHQR